MRRYKGVETLLNVAPEFKGRAKFVIAGRSGRYDPGGALPQNCIRIDGHMDGDKLAALFSAADFIVLPFEEITVSGTLLLAMTYGVPVIAPAYQGISSVVRDGSEGFLYQSDDDSRVLALAVERALSTEKWQREAMEMSASAIAAFRPPDAFAAAVRATFESASSSRSHPSSLEPVHGKILPDHGADKERAGW